MGLRRTRAGRDKRPRACDKNQDVHKAWPMAVVRTHRGGTGRQCVVGAWANWRTVGKNSTTPRADVLPQRDAAHDARYRESRGKDILPATWDGSSLPFFYIDESETEEFTQSWERLQNYGINGQQVEQGHKLAIADLACLGASTGGE